jgi:pSer/pThr/pTyr-binding forkhead associated (FHA) protein
VLTVKELRRLISTLSPAQLTDQLGPFVLVRRPPDEAARRAQIPGPAATAPRSEQAIAQNALALLFQFENLAVANLLPIEGQTQIVIGRLADCDLVVDEESVSKRHAILKWHNDRCTLEDLQSTNGTFLNASTRIKSEIALKDGDIVSFGDVQFWYLLTPTLHAKLRAGSFVGVASG